MKEKPFFKTKKITLKDIKIPNMNKKLNHKIILILTIILIGIVFFSGISFGKMMYNGILKNRVEIAKPILEVEKNSEVIITEANRKGEYEFKVKNYNTSEEISEVDLKYYIEILEENLDKAIQFELYKENEKMELQDNKTNEIYLTKNERCYSIAYYHIYVVFNLICFFTRRFNLFSIFSFRNSVRKKFNKYSSIRNINNNLS